MPKRAAGRRNAQVARDRQLRAGTERGAVDRGDRRERSVVQPLEHDAQRGREAFVLEPGQIGARAEVAAGAGQDEDARDGISALRVGDGCLQPGERVPIDGVATFGTIDGDQRDRTALFVMDHPATAPPPTLERRAR